MRECIKKSNSLVSLVLKTSSNHCIFFENAADWIIIVNSACYRDMIIQFFILKSQDMDMNDMWFQQDDITCHTLRKTVQLLHELFPGCNFPFFIRIGRPDRVM